MGSKQSVSVPTMNLDISTSALIPPESISLFDSSNSTISSTPPSCLSECYGCSFHNGLENPPCGNTIDELSTKESGYIALSQRVLPHNSMKSSSLKEKVDLNQISSTSLKSAKSSKKPSRNTKQRKYLWRPMPELEHPLPVKRVKRLSERLKKKYPTIRPVVYQYTSDTVSYIVKDVRAIQRARFYMERLAVKDIIKSNNRQLL